jgi:hypothetical protein
LPIFISYSHQDSEFVDRLALQLVKARALVWLDRWELNVGDSLVRRVEEAVAGASALIVVLSNASVASEWCRKELSAGLVRELEEKRVVVMPVRLDDCTFPLFLREKKFADFRTDFDTGLADLLKAVARVTTDTRSRVEEPEWHIDWSVDWGMENGTAAYVLSFVEQAVDKPYTSLIVARIRGNAQATARYKLYEREGLSWLHRHILMESLADASSKLDLRLVLQDPQPRQLEFAIRDDKHGIEWTASVECRLLGEDSGSDVLVDVAGLFARSAEHSRSSSRQPTQEEQARIARVIATLE